MTRLPALLRSIAADIRGGVTTIGALSLTSVVGMSGLAMEVGHGYAQKVANQRIADAAALAAGLAYSAGSDASLILPTAQAIARANGLPATAVAAPAPTTDAQGRTLISVTVTAPVSLYLSRVLTSRSAYDVQATGVAAVTAGGSSSSTTSSAPGCIIALSQTATDGILMVGGVSLIAETCSVNSNRRISIQNGPTLKAKTIVTGQTLARTGGTTVTGELKENQSSAATDPLALNTQLKAQLDKVGTYVTPAAIANPSTPAGSDWTFDWNGNAPVQSFKVAGGEFRVPAGNYTVGKLTVGGGVKVTFAPGANLTIANGFTSGGTVTLGSSGSWKVNGGFDTGWSGFAPGSVSFHIGSGSNLFRGNTLTFGDGAFILNGTLTVDGGVTLTFGAGSHSFGRIENNGTQLTLGNGDLTVPGGISVKGGSKMTVGNGNIVLGDTSGTAIYIGGGGNLKIGDGSFSANGNILSDGDGVLSIGAATNHFVNGYMNLQGSTSFGAGAWTIAGYLKNGTGGLLSGTNVSFYLGGALDFAGGARMELRASQTTSGEALADILFATRTTTGSLLDAGSGTPSVLRGVLYSPRAGFTMKGGQSIDGSGCFQIIADTVVLQAGASTATSCAGTSSTTTVTTQSPPTVVLIR